VSIWLRILLGVNVLVLSATAAIGLLSARIAGRVVEQRLIRHTARRTGEFLRTQALPFNDRLMSYLKRMHGADFVTVRVDEGRIAGSSLSPETAEVFRGQLASLGEDGTIELAGRTYRYDSHRLRAAPEPGRPAPEALRLYAIVDAEAFDAARDLAATRIAHSAVWVFLAASVLALGLSLTITRPIRRLAGRMRSMRCPTPEADPASIVPPSPDAPGRPGGPSEVARLEAEFGRLMQRLDHAGRELARQERLATLGRVAAGVVHELRNPLSGIVMNLRVLRDRVGDDEGLRASLREAERMKTYLDQLTDLARGGSEGAGSPGDLQALGATRLSDPLDSALSLMGARLARRGIDVVRRYDPDGPVVRCDEGRIAQLAINLVVNALDAMESGGTLTVSTARRDDGRAELRVADTGGGVQPELGETLFDPFVSTKRGSAGLGLYVCRLIARAHGGAVRHRTTEHGAEFIVELPDHPPATPGPGEHPSP
jgi:signal transduction histidine kinase